MRKAGTSERRLLDLRIATFQGASPLTRTAHLRGVCLTLDSDISGGVSSNPHSALRVCGSVTQARLTLCGPVDCSLPGSSVHGIFQARALERVATSYSRDLPSSGNEPVSPAPRILAARFFTTVPPGRPNVFLTNHLPIFVTIWALLNVSISNRPLTSPVIFTQWP